MAMKTILGRIVFLAHFSLALAAETTVGKTGRPILRNIVCTMQHAAMSRSLARQFFIRKCQLKCARRFNSRFVTTTDLWSML
jgi:hypothetical protein